MSQNISTSENEVTWEDETHPRSKRFDDTYFSKADGRAETAHVFINGNDLPGRWPQSNEFTIGELGFGTGLNFLETVRQWHQFKPPGAKLNYISFEQFPINTREIEKALSPWPELEILTGQLIQLWSTDYEMLDVAFEDDIHLMVFMGDVNQRLSKMEFQADAWYLDGFSPPKNPEMWNAKLIKSVFNTTISGGSFATYSVAGNVRRNLQAAGFNVKKQTGFAGKREMLAGNRAGS